MLGEYLKRYRLGRNMSQAEFAKVLNTSQSYYARLETNKRRPGFEMIRKIAKELHVDEAFVRNLL